MSNILLNTKASLFVFAGRFSERLIGLVSTLILARLLLPDDFGVVALVWLVLKFIEAMAVSGAEEYIIQKESIDNKDLCTAWSIDLILKVLIVLSVVAITPFVVSYYDEPRLSLALPAMSMIMIVGSFINPYNYILKRERNYSKLFKIDIIAKVVSATTTISLAFFLRSFWALIIGHLSSALVKCILSYVFFSFRPKITFCRYREQLGFSQWMFLRGIFGYVRASLDIFLVSHRFSTGTLGGYHVSRYIAMMPGADGIGPLMAPLFASFSNVQEDKERLRYQVSFSLLALMAISLPLAAFMYVNAPEISELLLGSKWSSFTAVFAVLSLAVITRPLHNFCVAILLVLKQTKRAFYYDVITLIGMALVLMCMPIETILQFAWYKTGFDLICVTSFLIYILFQLGSMRIVSILFLITVTCVFVFFAGWSVSRVVTDAYGSFISLAIEGMLCLSIWFFYCFLVFYFFFRTTTIGYHIKFLLKKNLKFFRSQK